MKLQNSYIFIPNKFMQSVRKKEKEFSNPNNSQDLKSIYGLLKTQYGLVTDHNADDFIYIRSGASLLAIGNYEVRLTVICTDLGKSIFVKVVVDGNSIHRCIDGLSLVHQFVFDPEGLCEKRYVSLISYDAVSKYYCDKIYPVLNEFERMLRELIFNVYVANLGEEYFNKTVDKGLQDKVKGKIKDKNNTERFRQYFYNLDYSNIHELLFVKHWTDYDEDQKQAKLNSVVDFTKISDENIRATIEEIGPKSDWERFFNRSLPNNELEQLMKEIQQYRNSIAHCKIFQKKDYDICLKLLHDLQKSLKSAIKFTEEIEFPEKHREYFSEIMKSVAVTWEIIANQLREATQPIVEISSILSRALGSLHLDFINFGNMLKGIDVPADYENDVMKDEKENEGDDSSIS